MIIDSVILSRREAAGPGKSEHNVELNDFDKSEVPATPTADGVGSPGAGDQQRKEDTLQYPWCHQFGYESPLSVLFLC